MGTERAQSSDLYDDRDSSSEQTGHTLIVEKRTLLKLRKCRLLVQSGPDANKDVVTEKERIRVGHARHFAGADGVQNDLSLDDKKVSRHHFEICFTENGYLLVDLQSTNGTFLDGKRVERAYLAAGSQIVVGDDVLVFTPLNEEIEVSPDSEGFFAGMVGKSLKMRQIFALLKKVAPMDVSVLITGETGTGKELVARAVHDHSPRRKGPFVVLDCGAIPENLIESELFGHERGAFTGADRVREGAFERAQGGTIFLDELGELRSDLQPRLLRVLEAREVRRVGGSNVIDLDVRVVAATNRDLAKEVADGNFREDLFFRLSVINLSLPPLRARREDIAALMTHALAQADVIARHGVKRVTPAALAILTGYAWPGNVREFMNVVSHVLTFSEGPEIDVVHLPPRLTGSPDKVAPLSFNEHLGFHEAKVQVLEAFEREYLATLLKRCEGNISRAARESGLHRKSIERLLKKYQLDARELAR